MKPTHSFRLFALLVLLTGFSATTVYAQRNTPKKPSKQELFFQDIEKLQPGMTQAEVKAIMGEPYKLI